MIVGALSWFDEAPTWLAYCVASAAKLCDHLVAVDGAYAVFPRRPRGSSGAAQHEAIIRTAEAAGMGVTLHVPSGPWMGNEVEKRDFMMREACRLAEPGEDWLLVIDADEVVLEAPPKELVLAELAEAELPVAAVGYVQRHDHYAWQPIGEEEWPEEKLVVDCASPSISAGRTRRLFRVDETLRVEGTHYHYRIDGERGPVDLWQVPGASEAADLTRVVLEHRHEFRDPERRKAGEAYYYVRNNLGLERPPGEPASRLVGG